MRLCLLVACLGLAGTSAEPAFAQESVEDVFGDLGTATTAEPGEAGADSGDQGSVVGRVFGAGTGSPLPGVTVIVEWPAPADGGEPRQEVQVSDATGAFAFPEIPAGTYSITFIKSGYRNSTMRSFQVVAGQPNRADFPLPPVAAETSDEVLELEEFVVEAETVEELMTTLELRTDSDQILNILSAEDFSKFAAGDVAEALERVAGVTVADGQFAVIRGLEDRYNSTVYNGAVVPSPDPDRQSVQLDLFPSEVVGNLLVAKSFSPELPGNSSGGAIDIITHVYDEEVTFSLKGGTGWNSNAYRRFLRFDGLSNADRIVNGIEFPEVSDPANRLTVDMLREDFGFRYVGGNPVGVEDSKSGDWFDDLDDVLEKDFVATFGGTKEFADREFRLKIVASREVDYSSKFGFQQGLEPRPTRTEVSEPVVDPTVFPQPCLSDPDIPCFITTTTTVLSGDLSLGEMNLTDGRYEFTESTREERTTGFAAFGFDLDDEGYHRIDTSAFYTRNEQQTVQLRENGFLPGLDYRALALEQAGDGIDLEAPDRNAGFNVATLGSPILRNFRARDDSSLQSGAVAWASFFRSGSFQRDRDLRIYQINGDHTFQELPELHISWATNWAKTTQEEVSLTMNYWYEPCGLVSPVPCPEGTLARSVDDFFPEGQEVTAAPTVAEIGPGAFVTNQDLVLSANIIEETSRFSRIDMDYEVEFTQASRFFIAGGWWQEKADRTVDSVFLSPVSTNPSFPGCGGQQTSARCLAATPLELGRTAFDALLVDQFGILGGLTSNANESSRTVDAWHLRGKWTLWERLDLLGGVRWEDILIVSNNDPFTGELDPFLRPAIFPSRYVLFDRLDNAFIINGNINSAEVAGGFPPPGAIYNDQVLGIDVPVGPCQGTQPPTPVEVPSGVTCVDFFTREEVESIIDGEIDESRTLPSLGFAFRPIEGLSIRGSWSETVARPSFRELGYYVSVEPGTDDLTIGNPQLQLSDVESKDIRVEYTWGAYGDLLAFSYFEKDIERPIESILVRDPSDASDFRAVFRTFFNNPNTADLEGWEAEGRISFGLLAGDFSGGPSWWPHLGAPDWVRYLSIGGNYTDIEATVARSEFERIQVAPFFGLVEGEEAVFTELAATRRLFNQPEWIANLDITFDHPDWGTKVTVAFFAISDLLDAAGSVVRKNGFDSYTPDRYIDSYHELRATLSQKFELPNDFGTLTFKLTGKNLTNSRRRIIYDPNQFVDDFVEREFREGRDFDVSLTYSRTF